MGKKYGLYECQYTVESKFFTVAKPVWSKSSKQTFLQTYKLPKLKGKARLVVYQNAFFV